jgi:DNA-directed RNA polymerase subunit RPC12/RpoP
MPILLNCACGRSLRVKDILAGRKVRCPDCSSILTVPRPEPVRDAEDEALDVLLDETPSDPPVVRLAAREAVANAGEQVRQPLPASRPLPPLPAKQPAALANLRKPARAKTSRRSSPPLVVNREIVAGVLMMLGAVVWFGLGLLLGWVYFYPPVLFVLGIAAVIRGFKGEA